MTSPASGRLSLDVPVSNPRLNPQRRREISRVLLDSLGDGFPPGVALAVLDRAGVMLRAWSGAATLIPDAEPVESDTLFDLASLTKVMTLYLLFEQIEAGRFNTDQPDILVLQKVRENPHGV